MQIRQWRAMWGAALVWDKERAKITAINAGPVAAVTMIVVGASLWLGSPLAAAGFILVGAGVICNMYVLDFIFSRPGIELYEQLSRQRLIEYGRKRGMSDEEINQIIKDVNDLMSE